MTFLCNMIYFTTVLIFGTAVSFCFAGIPMQRKSLVSLLLFCAVEGVLQIMIAWHFGLGTAKQLYPLIVHLPLVLFLVLALRCTPLNAVISVLSAYLCCQIPWWFSYFFNLFFTGEIAHTILYVLFACLAFAGLFRYIAKPTEHFMKHSRKSALLTGAVPLFYYLFDYATTVYTDWLYSGETAAVQFMPSVIACFYFLFIIVYYQELSLKEEAKHQAETLSLQLQYAAGTLDHMRQLQANAVTYRHDMRHHFAYIQALASSGSLNKLQEYIQTIQSGLEALTPEQFCQNEVINLILATYRLKAKKEEISLDIHANVPNNISISDTNLCVLLSNALENALHAAGQTDSRTISVRMSIRHSSLLLQIVNPFCGEVTFKDQLPVAAEEAHGIGTRSIEAVVEACHGQYEFFTENNYFTFRALLPLAESRHD